ncbi:uncharacterized protein [Linepithema humile]|uniref:uncharacterized protein n=1 Tax=Linepithema humile TaxID=83485 RepID=UPI000623424E|nr:PREDICTED: uncharacterized protein LOC105669908 [Linepithema humile]
MKYLGLTLDGLWKFTQHFDAVAPRVDRMANALCRLLPNLGGPGAKVRHLYANTVRSVSLYGAPIWAEDLMANKRVMALVRKADRRMAIRVARCYRTVSYVAATTLAGVLPFDLVAASRAEAYRCAIEVGRSGIAPENIPRKVEREGQGPEVGAQGVETPTGRTHYSGSSWN